MERRKRIAARVAEELKDGDVVNLGIGVPTLVAEYIDPNLEVYLHAENGIMHMGPAITEDIDHNVINAGGAYSSILPGGSFLDSVTSFGFIRGGHVNVTVLGALQVDEKGSMASWMVPGKQITGMGGAMDLVVGAKKVIIAMEHTTKDGKPKILKDCTLPLTAKEQVNLIVTDLAVLEVTPKGLLLKELAPGVSLEQVKEMTEASLIISESIIKDESLLKGGKVYENCCLCEADF